MKIKTKEAEKKMLQSKKAASVMLYIILGIIIVLATAYGLYLQKQLQKSKLTPGELEAPLQIAPVKAYIDDCTYSVATEGLQKIGMTGGYIDASLLKTNDLEPTEADAVSAFGTPVAYWWYLKSDNKCVGECKFISQKPALYKTSGEPSIEGQLDKYIKKELPRCLAGFAPLKEQGYEITEKGDITIETKVNEKDLGVYVKYPLEVRKAGIEYSLEEFYVPMQIDLRKIFLVATNLTNFQASDETRYLENFALNLIAAFSGTTKDKLPSIADTEFKATGTIWSETKVKQDMQDILTVYTQSMQVEGTTNYKRTIFQDALTQQIYDDLIMPNRKITAPHNGLAIEFNYLDWPIYFDLNCRGGICRPEQAYTTNMLIIPFGIQRYSFAYDVSFPVVISIKDPNALRGKGYTFNFALEGNLRNNEPMTKEFYPISQIDFGGKTMLCDENKRNTGTINIFLKDGITGGQVDEAVVTFTSGGEGCMIGMTEATGKASTDKAGSSSKEIPAMSTKLPVGCGFLSFTKENYLGKNKYLCTDLEKEMNINEQLEPYRTVNFTITKKKIVRKSDGKWEFEKEREFPMLYKEEAIIMLERIAADGESDFTTAFSIESGKNNDRTEVSLPPGKYLVTANLLYNSPVRIPDQQVKQNTQSALGIFGSSKSTIEGITFDIYPEGAIEWDSEEYAWTLTGPEIDAAADGGLIVLPIISSDLVNVREADRTYEDLDAIGDLAQKSRDYSGYLRPYVK